MILQALCDLYEVIEGAADYKVAPRGRSRQKMSFKIVLHADGGLVGVQFIGERQGNRVSPVPMVVPGVTKPTGSGLNPCFLWDNTAYLLGWDIRPEREQRAQKAFHCWRNAHLSVEGEIDHPAFSAVCRFAEAWEPDHAAEYLEILEMAANGFGCFQIVGQERYVHDVPEILAWWDRRTAGEPDRMRRWFSLPSAEVAGQGDADDEAPRAQCLVTGELIKASEIARLHPKIKGVAGAQSSGATIAGFNDSAYESWGFEQSYNAPVSQEAARRYVTALNALLDGPMKTRHRLVVGGTTVVFWAERLDSPATDIFAQAGFGTPDPEQRLDEEGRQGLEQALRCLRAGRPMPWASWDETEGASRFYVLGLAAPTPARIAVRFFRDMSVIEMFKRLAAHFDDIGIERQYGEGTKNPEPEYPSFYYLLGGLQAKGGDPPAVLAAAFVDSVIAMRRYPEALLPAVLSRIVADRQITYPRACLIKGYLVRNAGKEISVSLDTSTLSPAYRLGRLFAVLEKTQTDALPGIKSTIRERYYSSASATPAAVFPRLLRTWQHHLASLEHVGQRVNYDKLTQEILDPLDAFPTHLDLVGQGEFALGYYHQRNALYQRSSERQDTTENVTAS